MKSEIVVDGEKYVLASSVENLKPAHSLKGKKYVIVRTYSAGVFAGYLESRNGKEGVILDSRRIWYWKGANSLSQLAIEGVKFPAECKFGMVVPRTELTEIIEVIDVTEVAQKNIQGVFVWKQ